MSDPAAPAAGCCHVLQVQAGRRYLLCMCGRSRKKPMCDGAHAGSGKLPYFYTAGQTGEVRVCGCYGSSTGPLCDGKCAAEGGGAG